MHVAAEPNDKVEPQLLLQLCVERGITESSVRQHDDSDLTVLRETGLEQVQELVLMPVAAPFHRGRLDRLPEQRGGTTMLRHQ